MKNFHRAYTGVSLCGLNCLLCTMHIGGYCPGCGGGAGNQSCTLARCAMTQQVEFCSQCPQYPCSKYDGIDAYDSFISHQNQTANLEQIKLTGLDAYKKDLEERAAILSTLLAQFDNGRSKTLFSAAANLLELEPLKQIMEQLSACQTPITSKKDRAAVATKALQAAADKQGISLKLRKKP